MMVILRSAALVCPSDKQWIIDGVYLLECCLAIGHLIHLLVASIILRRAIIVSISRYMLIIACLGAGVAVPAHFYHG